MTKADWLDFFEAINGRSATEEEIAAALAAGEFQDDAPAVEAAPVQEAPQDKLYRIKHFNLKQVLQMRKLVNKQPLLTVNLFNQVKISNLSMAKL